jgi:acyl carrier protein
MTTAPSTRAQIIVAIDKVLTDSGRTPREFTDQDALAADIGLDSLDLAVLVVTLEQQLGIDPFREATRTARTLGDLVDIYMQALATKS